MAAIRWCATPAKVPTRSSTRFVAANPELALDAAAIRAGEKTTVPVEQAIKDKLITAEEAAGATEMAVYTVPGAGAFKMVADPGRGELDRWSSPSCSCWSST